ncbi:MAG: hypothetical protein JW768_12970 [Chitinispirillaceae bacterium]|nr:hypothetical protein [Chitinispirillaceae bacterium]
MKKITLLLIAVGIIGGSVCAKDATVKKGAKIMDTIKIESTAFGHMQPIPPQYTCDGADISSRTLVEQRPCRRSWYCP